MVDRARKWRAQKQDIFIKHSPIRNEFVVSGSTGEDYRVNLEYPSCTCPDRQKRKPDDGCKHILHVKIEKGELDPIPSAKTNFGDPKSRSQSNYPSNWDSLSKRTKKRDKWTCQKCGAQGGPYGSARLAAHHIRPKSQGGRDNLDNLITVCHSCHEEEHGHSIPKGGTASSASGSSSRTETGSQKSLVEMGNEEDEFDDEYGPYGSSPESSFPRSPSSEAESKSESSDGEDSSTGPKGKTSTEDSESSELIPSVPTIVTEEDPFPFSLSLVFTLPFFILLVIVRVIFSVSQLSWLVIILLTIAFWLLTLIVIDDHREEVEELRATNDDVRLVVKEVNKRYSEEGEVSQNVVNYTREQLEKAENQSSSSVIVMSDDYEDWLENVKEILKDLETS